MKLDNYLFEEKYHPKGIDEVVLPTRIKNIVKGIIDSGNISGFLFSGSPGTGKTTTAKVICQELGVDYHVIEGSVNNGVDFVRNQLFELAQASTTNGNYSVIIIDECDYMTKNAQAALRNIINLTQGYCRWILTANYPQKIIPAIRGSRLVEVSFSPSRQETIQEVAPQLWKRMNEIIKKEGIKVEDYGTLQSWMVKCLPNIRYILKCIQIMSSQNGRVLPKDIDLEQNVLTPESFSALVKSPYDSIVKFVYGTPQESIVEFLLENTLDVFPEENIAKAVTIISQFQSLSKGVEEIYTISMLLNLKNLLK